MEDPSGNRNFDPIGFKTVAASFLERFLWVRMDAFDSDLWQEKKGFASEMDDGYLFINTSMIEEC